MLLLFSMVTLVGENNRTNRENLRTRIKGTQSILDKEIESHLEKAKALQEKKATENASLSYEDHMGFVAHYGYSSDLLGRICTCMDMRNSYTSADAYLCYEQDKSEEYIKGFEGREHVYNTVKRYLDLVTTEKQSQNIFLPEISPASELKIYIKQERR